MQFHQRTTHDTRLPVHGEKQTKRHVTNEGSRDLDQRERHDWAWLKQLTCPHDTLMQIQNTARLLYFTAVHESFKEISKKIHE